MDLITKLNFQYLILCIRKENLMDIFPERVGQFVFRF